MSLLVPVLLAPAPSASCRMQPFRRQRNQGHGLACEVRVPVHSSNWSPQQVLALRTLDFLIFALRAARFDQFLTFYFCCHMLHTRHQCSSCQADRNFGIVKQRCMQSARVQQWAAMRLPSTSQFIHDGNSKAVPVVQHCAVGVPRLRLWGVAPSTLGKARPGLRQDPNRHTSNGKRKIGRVGRVVVLAPQSD